MWIAVFAVKTERQKTRNQKIFEIFDQRVYIVSTFTKKLSIYEYDSMVLSILSKNMIDTFCECKFL